jgi:hypothetical protein
MNVKPNELRRGNLVLSTSKYWDKPTIGTVDEINSQNIIFRYSATSIIGNDYSVIEGIPLTEEWLIKLGFLKNNDPDNLYFIIPNMIVIDVNSGFEYRSGQYVPLQIKFVHKLQNLFFELRGEELTIKQ